MRQTLTERAMGAEDRRLRLRELMAEYELTPAEVGEMVDRSPLTVRAWMSGNCPITDHTIALIELILRMRLVA